MYQKAYCILIEDPKIQKKKKRKKLRQDCGFLHTRVLSLIVVM